MSITQDQLDLILGPQMPAGSTWFDATELAMATSLGQACPAVPPVDPGALNDYELHLQYYDLGKSIAIVRQRVLSDPQLASRLTAYFRNATDSWWQHPWIASGSTSARLFPDSASPPPRHAGVGGLILRALDGRPEMWDWIIAYTRALLNAYIFNHLNDAALWVDIREGAFMLKYAVWLSQVVPDSYPAQDGTTMADGSQIRAEMLAKAEKAVIGYYQRLQFPCGCWRYDAPGVFDPDGGSITGVTQPFTIGLLMDAFTDLHRVSVNQSVKDAIVAMSVKVLKHLYLDGPYRKNDPAQYDPTKRLRCFYYFYHGGTTVNPDKFANGGWSVTGINADEIKDQRQGNGPLVAAYGYFYGVSKDPVLLEAGNELWDASYNGTDGIRNNMADDGKGFNQNCNRAGSYPIWAGLPAQPGGQVVTLPPAPVPASTAAPVISAPLSGAVLSGVVNVTGSVGGSIAAVDLIVDGVFSGELTTSTFSFKLDTTKLVDGGHVLFVRAWDTLGTAHDSPQLAFSVANQVVVPVPAPTPTPTPTPIPAPSPLPAPKYSYTSAPQPRTDTDMLALLNKNGAQGLRPAMTWNGRVYFEKAG